MSGWNAPDKPTHLKKCSEFHDPNCGQPLTDGCCPVIPCSYCLTWSVYGEDDVFGVADRSGSEWTGTIAGAVFAGYWARDPYTDECQFVVTLDGEEVYRKSCSEGQSCRDSSDEVETVIGYDAGTLRWDKRLHRPLEYVTDYDTKCRRRFCGDCECTCQCLCVVITDEYTGNEIARGEICDTAYPCDGPVWEGTVSGTRDGEPVDFDLSLALQEGDCSIVVSEGGYEVGTMSTTGCTDLTGTMLLDADTRLTVTCKVCDCTPTVYCPCCPGWNEQYSGIIHWSSTPATSTDCEGSLEEIDGDFTCVGEGADTEIRPSSSYDFFVRVVCDPDTAEWKLQYRSPTSGGPPFNLAAASTVWADATDVVFECPDCANAIDGVAYGSVSGTGHAACDSSGGELEFDVAISGVIEIGC